MSISIAVAVAAAALSVAPVPRDTAQFTFRRSELAGESGASAVYKRMKKSAAEACDLQLPTRLYRAAGACEEALLDDWVKAAGDSRLQKLHDDAR